MHERPSAMDWRWHRQSGPFFHHPRQEYSNPVCPGYHEKHANQEHQTITPFCLLTLSPCRPPPPVSNPCSHYALHTELCCKSRSILKGSVIILFFFFSTTNYTNAHNHCMRLCGVLKSAFSNPFNITCFCPHLYARHPGLSLPVGGRSRPRIRKMKITESDRKTSTADTLRDPRV